MGCGMRGFISNHHCRLRAKVIVALALDLLCACEILRGSDTINIPGYRWFGHKRVNISKRGVRGSGGVGILIKDSFFNNLSVDIVNKSHEDIMWVPGTQTRDPDQALYICTYHQRHRVEGINLINFFDILKQQILHFQDKGEI